ncbi:hypothetical protein VTK56DRAFT_817 [Thermocarpiscus australiensis]
MEELEQTAREVIRALKSVNGSKYSNLRVAVIGGLARMHYNPKGRVTNDVDFIVDTPKMTIAPEIKNAIVNLSGFDFCQLADIFYHKYKTPEGETRYHQVDFVARDVCPYLPAVAQQVQDIPEGTIPYISHTDLIVFKVHSCGLRAAEFKRNNNATDAKALLNMVATPLALTLQ